MEPLLSSTELRPNPGPSPRISTSSVSLKLLAVALILVFLYFAASVVITLLLAILIAYFLDPIVEFLERMRMPRTLGSMITVLFLISVLGAVGYGLYSRGSDFAANWPKYSGTLRNAVNSVETKINGIESQVSEGEIPSQPSQHKGPSKTLAGAENALRAAVMHIIGSLSGLVLEVTFVPFLVFFMLAEKQEVWHSTLQLFPVSRRTPVKETLEDLRDLVGMSLMTLIVMAASSAFFWAMGLDYPILTGIVSGLLNMVPYFGAVLSWLPPFLIALAKLPSAGSYALIAGVLMAIHMLANNLLAPALVGKKVQLNALSITIALLFWGWIWGGMGLLLAIPLTAALRVICDHSQAWKPIGRWLSA
jgi:predicted PurR-regulated permease PerM